MRRFLSPVLPAADAVIALEAGVSHHILRVTGIAPGESLELFDGQGGVCEAVLEGVEGGLARVRWTSKGTPLVLPPRWLLIGLLKRQTFDGVVRMATELGVSAIWPVQLSRSVPKGGRLDRWERIAASAAGQCGRTSLRALWRWWGRWDPKYTFYFFIVCRNVIHVNVVRSLSVNTSIVT